MVNLSVVITALVLRLVTADGDGCTPLPNNHFHWLNADGSLIRPQPLNHYRNLLRYEGVPISSESCGPLGSHKWRPVPGYPSCKFCSQNYSLVCQGSDVFDVPNSDALPSTKLFSFKISGAGLISLSPKSFKGISVQNLIIENSNLSYLAVNSFGEVKSIRSLSLKNNKLDYISHANYLFQNISGLEFLSLEDNRLKVMTSSGSANLHNLTYFSSAGNPLHTMDVFFLQNSGLIFLDLRNVVFKLKDIDFIGSGLNKLPRSLDAVDLSRAMITNRAIKKLMEQLKGKSITTLSLSYLQTQFQSFSALRHIRKSLTYLSLKGTDLSNILNPRMAKAHLSEPAKFMNMKELNWENCNISFYEPSMTRLFPNLEVLSLAGNSFLILDLTFFAYLPKLVFIDLSNNTILDVVTNKAQVEVKNLKGADLSNSKLLLSNDESYVLFSILKNLQMLSLCRTELSPNVADSLSHLNNLKYLDVSAALMSQELSPIFNELFSKNNSSLIELYFSQNNFQPKNNNSLQFSLLSSLEVLDISNNLFRELSDDIFAPSLKTLNVSQNLITTWYETLLKNNSQLQYLDMSNNQITYVSEAMIRDFYELDFLNLNNNPLICHNKVVALVCSNIKNDSETFINETHIKESNNHKIPHRLESTKNNSLSLTLTGWEQYRCYDVLSNGYRQFSQQKDCIEYYDEVSTIHSIKNPTTQYPETTKSIQPNAKKYAWNWEWTYLILGSIIVVTSLGGIVYVKWWSIRCFFHRYISLKKVQLLQKNGNLSTKPEVTYDVFVSYSDLDRPWILDHLVPSMERDGDVSLCFHERDFQVGMTILENIINCMDRSHALLLVVSNAFIYSKWCQFEMHLAQYRLIETFRDQLVLVLLEDIPRQSRPQTLRHLMTSKTYLMWPQPPCKDEAYDLFWRRLKRALKPHPNHFLPV